MIAITTMLIDHVGAVFDLHMGYRVIGRIAFPLFVFLIAEGCRHTKSMEKYLIRLGLFALLSEIPFDLAFNDSIDFFNNTNIFYTLFLGTLCVYIFRIFYLFGQARKDHFWILSAIPIYGIMMAADWLGSDYGGIGVLFIFLMSAAGILKFPHIVQYVIVVLFMMWLYFPFIAFLAGSLISLALIAFYNGRKGFSFKYDKWIFYIFYPLHLFIIYLFYYF